MKKLYGFALLLMLLLVLINPCYSSGLDKNQVRDTAYSPAWDGLGETSPSQNAVYDKMSEVIASTGGFVKKAGDTMTGELIVPNIDVDTITSSQGIDIQPNSDTNDYLRFETLANVPNIKTLGAVGIRFTNDIADNVEIIMFEDVSSFLRLRWEKDNNRSIIQSVGGQLDLLSPVDIALFANSDSNDNFYFRTSTNTPYLRVDGASVEAALRFWDATDRFQIDNGNGFNDLIATSSPTWVAGDTLVYDGADWVIASSKSFICVDIDTTTTSTTVAGEWRVVAGTYTENSGNGFRIDNSITGSTITYVGTQTYNFSVTIALSASSSGANEVIHWRIAKNGVMFERSESHMSIPTALVIHAVPLTYAVNLATNDEISLYLKTNTGDTITHEHLNITIAQID